MKIDKSKSVFMTRRLLLTGSACTLLLACGGRTAAGQDESDRPPKSVDDAEANELGGTEAMPLPAIRGYYRLGDHLAVVMKDAGCHALTLSPETTGVLYATVQAAETCAAPELVVAEALPSATPVIVTNPIVNTDWSSSDICAAEQLASLALFDGASWEKASFLREHDYVPYYETLGDRSSRTHYFNCSEAAPYLAKAFYDLTP